MGGGYFFRKKSNFFLFKNWLKWGRPQEKGFNHFSTQNCYYVCFSDLWTWHGQKHKNNGIFKGFLYCLAMTSSKVRKTYIIAVFGAKMVETFFWGSSTHLINFWTKKNLIFFEKNPPPPPLNLADISVIVKKLMYRLNQIV